MQEGQETKQEETPVVTNENIEVKSEQIGEVQDTKQEVREVKLITDPQERMDAFNQLHILTNLINTSYYLPKLDKGNGMTEKQKITSSVQLNYFGSVQLNEWGAKIVELSERLGLNGEYNNGKGN